jgi:organic hydroperoxide reductase OsmC/OhrA
MSNFPHDYQVSASAQPSGNVGLSCSGCPDLQSAPPTAFGGPGNLWSPEDLLVAAVADCFILSFRAIASASKFEWINLKCRVIGTLDKVERSVQFTAFSIAAELTIPAGADGERAQRLLEKAEQTCFITNSLKVHPALETNIAVQ